jgi:hypothetical protein
MNRIKLAVVALILTATALIPGRSAATCDASQCFNLDCSHLVCPEGQVALPRCNLQTCAFTCACRQLPGH